MFEYIDVVMSSEDFYDDEFLDGIIKGWNILLWVVFCGNFMLLFFRNLLLILLLRVVDCVEYYVYSVKY